MTGFLPHMASEFEDPSSSVQPKRQSLNDRQIHLFNLLKKGRRTHERLEQLASLLSVSPRTIKRDLAQLKTARLIKTESHGRCGVRVTILKDRSKLNADRGQIGDRSGTSGTDNLGQQQTINSQKPENIRRLTSSDPYSDSLTTDNQSPSSGSEYSGESSDLIATALPPEPETRSGGSTTETLESVVDSDLANQGEQSAHSKPPMSAEDSALILETRRTSLLAIRTPATRKNLAKRWEEEDPDGAHLYAMRTQNECSRDNSKQNCASQLTRGKQ